MSLRVSSRPRGTVVHRPTVPEWGRTYMTRRGEPEQAAMACGLTAGAAPVVSDEEVSVVIGGSR